MAIRAVIISDPNVDVSTVHCRYDIQTSGVLFISSNIPITGRRVTLFLAWSASTYTVSFTGSPKGSGDLVGISSIASGKNSLQS
jgi:hypothetical protein